MNKIEDYKKNSAIKKVVKVVSFPFIFSGKLIVLPFYPVYLFGKYILHSLLRAQGKFEHEVNSFDTWYALKDINEEILEDNIRATALYAWVNLIFSLLGFALTFHFYLKGAEAISVASGAVFSFVILTMYFHYAVYCHCFKTRSFDRKLDVFKSIHSLFPNVMYEGVKVKSGKKSVPAQFYPKGKMIIKK
ncbi:hypothetical protein ACGGTC_004299 [Salmonella enterica]